MDEEFDMDMYLTSSYGALIILVLVLTVLAVRGSHRNKRALRIAKQTGPLVVLNEVKDVIAACRYSDFQKALAQWEEDLKAMKHGEEKYRMMLMPKRVEVDPTFTFANTDARTDLHTGSKEDSKRIMKDLVRYITGLGVEDVPDAINLLVVKDKRLIVPFTSIANGADAERQIKVHGHHTLTKALDTLVVGNK